MGDQRYFDDTCVRVYKANCSGNYIDPCDCRKYYECDSFQYLLKSKDCGLLLAFDHTIGNCIYNESVYFENTCDFTAPWIRCNVSDERKQWLQGLCTNTSNTLLPTSTTMKVQASKNEDNTGLIVGLVIALIIIVIIAAGFGIFWMYRRRKRREIEGKSTLPQMANPQHFAETDEDYQQIDDSMFIPMYGVYPESDSTRNPFPMPQPCEADRPVPNSNAQEDEIASSGGSSYQSIRGFDATSMPQPSDDDQEFANKTVSSEDSADIPVPNSNAQEDETASSGGSSYQSIRGFDATSMPQPSDADQEFATKTVSSEDSADRPVSNLNSQEDEIASSGGNSYESIRRSDTTAMPQQSDADE